MTDVQLQMMWGAIRTLLAVAGGWLVSAKIMDNATLETVLGAVMILLPLAWSVWSKHRAEEAAKAREAVAVNVGIAVSNAQPGIITPAVPAAMVPAVIAEVGPPAPAPTLAQKLGV